MTDYMTRYEEAEQKIRSKVTAEKGSARERVYIISTIALQEDELKELRLRLKTETEVHKRAEEALAKAYIKGT